MYFTATNSDPALTNGIAYQCFYNSVSNTLQTRQLAPWVRQGRANDVTSTLLFTDYNLFFVSYNDSKIFMDYYLGGSCGPGITRLGDGNEMPSTTQVPVASLNISIVPNPAAGAFDVHYNLLEEGTVQALVYNTLGELVTSSNATWKSVGQGEFSFYNTNLSNGMYVVRLMQNGQVKALQKLIIQH